MCDLVTGLMIGSQVLTGVMGHQAANAQADAQIAGVEAQAAIQQDQIDGSAITDKFERARQAQRERSAMKVATAESGLGGNLAYLQLADSLFQEGYDTSVTELNRRNSINASNTEMQNRINAANSERPSLFSTGLQIATGAMGTMQTQGHFKPDSKFMQSVGNFFS